MTKHGLQRGQISLLAFTILGGALASHAAAATEATTKPAAGGNPE